MVLANPTKAACDLKPAIARLMVYSNAFVTKVSAGIMARW